MKIEILNPVGEFIEYCDKHNFKLYFDNKIRFNIQLEKIKQDIPLLKKFLKGKVLNSKTTKKSLKELNTNILYYLLPFGENEHQWNYFLSLISPSERNFVINYFKIISEFYIRICIPIILRISSIIHQYCLCFSRLYFYNMPILIILY